MKLSLSRRTAAPLAALALLVSAPMASAADDPPSGAVNHAGEHYTLDGVAADAGTASQAPHVCSAAPTADGTVECFSSAQAQQQAGAEALRKGGLPAGYYGLPAGVSRAELTAIFDAGAKNATTTPPGSGPASSRSVSRKANRKPKVGSRAQTRAGYRCTNQSVAYIYTNANYQGVTGDQGLTGQNNWKNYSSKYDNEVSSFWNASTLFDARWHDYANGDGAYYGGGEKCRYVEDLRNANMSDGGTANDRFSSFADW